MCNMHGFKTFVYLFSWFKIILYSYTFYERLNWKYITKRLSWLLIVLNLRFVSSSWMGSWGWDACYPCTKHGHLALQFKIFWSFSCLYEDAFVLHTLFHNFPAFGGGGKTLFMSRIYNFVFLDCILFRLLLLISPFGLNQMVAVPCLIGILAIIFCA